jgi:hypothetical protein
MSRTKTREGPVARLANSDALARTVTIDLRWCDPPPTDTRFRGPISLPVRQSSVSEAMQRNRIVDLYSATRQAEDALLLTRP